jgi:HlyD family secretion protein
LKRVLLPVFLAGLSACADDAVVGPVYDVATAKRSTIEVSVSSSGVVEPLAIVEVKSKASGEVLDVRVEVGDLVDAGTLLVSIDPRTVSNDLAQREAELKAALSRREIAKSQMERAESLVAKGTFTQIDLEQAALDLANSEADVVSGQVSVENARIAVDDTDVRAPITGTVIQKPVEKGQVISSPTRDVAGGRPLMQMADLSKVQIRALIDETDIGKIRPGMRATISVAAYPNQPFPGDVIKIEPQAVIEQNVTMFAVLVAIDNSSGLLMPGMNAEVDVSIARSEGVVSIPVSALRTNRDIASTAGILGITEGSLRERLQPSVEPSVKQPGGRNERPREQAGGRRDGGQRSQTDYRFGGEFWVVMNDSGDVRKVRTGITDLDLVEIMDGLAESESVLILPSSHLVETQQELQNFINRRIGVPGIQRR